MAEQTSETSPMCNAERIAEQIAALTRAMRQFEAGCVGAAAALDKFNRDLHDAMNWAVSLQVLRAMAARPRENC